ncbi:MAG: hypothetical protein JO111_17350 [Caulobacteraceae bacterium]|nr:hypothetical protein [Caulobacteraceae bacterium]
MTETLARRTGAFRAPRNLHQEAAGSIHNDAVASKLGFRGGTVPGSIHMDQFVPLLAEVHGPAWFETGGMSVYFTRATTDNEEVQASIEPGVARTRLTMIDRTGAQICQGTAAVGGLDEGSELRTRMTGQTPAEPGGLRILADIAIGDEARDMAVKVTREKLDKALQTITEPVDAYAKDGVLPPSQIVHLAHMTRTTVMAKAKKSVGLFGALETQVFAGPLRADVDYLARSRILKLTESPKTENAWYEVIFREPGSDRDAGLVLYCLRFMKASSPLWSA